MKAAYLSAEAAMRSIKAGDKNYDVTEVINKITAAFDCKPVESAYLKFIRNAHAKQPFQICSRVAMSKTRSMARSRSFLVLRMHRRRMYRALLSVRTKYMVWMC